MAALGVFSLYVFFLLGYFIGPVVGNAPQGWIPYVFLGVWPVQAFLSIRAAKTGQDIHVRAACALASILFWTSLVYTALDRISFSIQFFLIGLEGLAAISFGALAAYVPLEEDDVGTEVP